MKKFWSLVLVVLCVLFVFSACGAGPVVSAGSPLCREDFNAYKDNTVSNDPDKNTSGMITFLPDEKTARGIGIGDSAKDAGEAYTCQGAKVNGSFLDGTAILVCKLDEYRLAIFFDEDLAVDTITIYNKIGIDALRSYFIDEFGAEDGAYKFSLLGLE